MIIEDVQNRPDDRGLALDRVGITGLRYPICVWDRQHAKQDTIAEISMAVGLPAQVKGAHLSRFIELLEEYAGELTQRTIPAVLDGMQQRLGSRTAHLRVAFPYFVSRSAPVSGATALMDYACTFTATADHDTVTFALSVRVPVTSVCPCSKAISDYGAHNQRGYLTVHVRPGGDRDGGFELVWIEELIDLAEAAASSPVYPLLKRADERHVTMAGYDNPVFVEDMVRAVATELRKDERIEAFRVKAVNEESIHNHGAYARLDWPPNPTPAAGAPWA